MPILPGLLTISPLGLSIAVVLQLIHVWKLVHGLFLRNLWCVPSCLCIIRDAQILMLSQYIIMNFGFSYNFGPIDLPDLQFPAAMSVDYIRIYQPKDAINYGCDPDNFPTADYINTCGFTTYSLVYSDWAFFFSIGMRSRIRTQISRRGNSMVNRGRRTKCRLLDVHDLVFSFFLGLTTAVDNSIQSI